jgi:hypothetical protein
VRILCACNYIGNACRFLFRCGCKNTPGGGGGNRYYITVGVGYMVALGKEHKGNPNNICQGLLIPSPDDGQWTSMVCVEGQVGWWVLIMCCQRDIDGQSQNTQDVVLRSGPPVENQEMLGKVWVEMVRYSHITINHSVINGFATPMKISSKIAALHSTTHS